MFRYFKKDVQPVLQFSATECGVACLAMLFKYYGCHVSMEELRDQCGASRDGTKAAKLIEIANKYGFDANAYRVELGTLLAMDKPVIAFWRFSHYVIIKRIAKDRVYINDPAYGALTVSLSDFDKYFTGVIIVVTPSSQYLATNQPKSAVSCVTRLLFEDNILALTVSVVCMLLCAVGPLMNSKSVSVFIDYCAIGRNKELLVYLVVFLFLQGMVFIIALGLQKIIQFRLVARASLIKSAKLMTHMLQLPLVFFSLRQKPEIFATLMRSEMATHSLFSSYSNILAGAILAIISFIALTYINYQLTGLLLVQLLFLMLPIKFLTGINSQYEHENAAKTGKYYSMVLSSIKNLVTIKSVCSESTIQMKLTQALYEKVSGLDKTNWVHLLLDNWLKLFNAISFIITLSVGSIRIVEGTLSIGNLITFYTLQLFFISQLTVITQSIKTMQGVVAAESRMNDLLNYPMDNRFKQLSLSKSAHGTISALSAIDLSFSFHPAAASILSGINLDIMAGQYVALVGSTGSGKSTLAKLLAHLYPVSSGKLLLYGSEYQRGGAAYFPDYFAYVSQEINLFSGTIYDNLTMWQKNIPLSVIESAIHDACLTDLIKDRGLDGSVEESGGNFSGGERQRLEIARALIQRPSILVLDEATSALDIETEKTLFERIAARGLTMIAVAHRLQTVMNCDCIYVMDQGKIVEQGTHHELLARRAHYYRLFMSGRNG